MKKLLLLVGIAVMLAGCSGDGEPEAGPSVVATSTSGDGPTTPPASESSESTAAPDATSTLIASDADLKTAVVAYSNAVLEGRAADAYALLSSACREAVDLASFTETVTAAHELYKVALPITSFQADVTGETAVVRYTYEVAALEQSDQPWTREDGGWRLDRCDAASTG